MQSVHEVMSRHLMAARDVNVPLQPQNPKSLLGVCASLRVLAMMEVRLDLHWSP